MRNTSKNVHNKSEWREMWIIFHREKGDRCMGRCDTKIVSQTFLISFKIMAVYFLVLQSASWFSSRSFVRGHKFPSNNNICFIKFYFAMEKFFKSHHKRQKLIGARSSWLGCDYTLILNNKIHPRAHGETQMGWILHHDSQFTKHMNGSLNENNKIKLIS